MNVILGALIVVIALVLPTILYIVLMEIYEKFIEKKGGE